MIATLWAHMCRTAFAIAVIAFACGLVAMAIHFPLLTVPTLFVLWWRQRGRQHVSDAYGSAVVSNIVDMSRRGMLDGHGPILGRILPETVAKTAAIGGLFSPKLRANAACRIFLAAFLGGGWLNGRMIRLKKHVHLCTFGPAGSGKGIGVLVPNLLSYPDSCVVTDPKGELAKLTGKARRKMGHTVVYLNPFDLHKLGSGSLNPLDFLDHRSDSFLDDCRDLANMMVVRTGKEHDPHWNDSCELVLTAAIAFVCACENDRSQRNFQTVRAILSSRHAFDKAVEIMQKHTDTAQGVIARLGGQLTWFQDKELGSVLTTVQRTTNFLDSPVIARHTENSSFNPMILRGKGGWFTRKKATVYLILPAEKLSSLSALQRLWIGTIMRVITRGTPTEKNPVLWLLDEMAHVGNVQAITDAVTLLRGAGMRLWFFFQSHQQMQTCFGEKWQTVLDNIGTLQYIGITSYETAEAISKRIGDQTVAIRTRSHTTSKSWPVGGTQTGGSPPDNHSSSTNVSSSEVARKLIQPEEVLKLNKELTLIFHENMSVIAARRLTYYRDREFKWGRRGRQPGIGLGAGIVAATVLAASFIFIQVAYRIAHVPAFQTAGYRRVMEPNSQQRANGLPGRFPQHR